MASKKGKAHAGGRAGAGAGAGARVGGRGPGSAAHLMENPFERLDNARPKHVVLNRRVKGDKRNMAMANLRSVESRRNELLSDYQRSRRVNSFDDRRFGEKDPTLSEEQKMLARFRKERVKRARKGSQFNLNDGPAPGAHDDEEMLLTHKGKVITDDYAEADVVLGSDEDENGELDREVVARLHFGGGSGPGQTYLRKKSKAEMLQDIIAKSKLAKAVKSQEKELQSEQLENIDKAFDELLVTNSLQIKQSKRDEADELMQSLLKKRKRDDKEKSLATATADLNTSTPELDEYDITFTDMLFEARAQATDRTKTPEEVAKEERERLEQLEAQRLMRMKSNMSAVENLQSPQMLAVDQNLSKRKRVTDDDLDDDFYEADGQEPPSVDGELESYRTDSHEAFNFFADGPEAEDELDIENDDEEENDDEGENGDEACDDDDDETDDVDDDGDVVDDREQTHDVDDGDIDEDCAEVEKHGVLSDESYILPELSNLPEQQIARRDKHDTSSKLYYDKHLKAIALPDSAPAPTDSEIPYVFECPSDESQLEEWILQYCKCSDDVCTLLYRIHRCNSKRLTENRGMETFYRMLFKQYISCGDKLRLGGDRNWDWQKLIDFLTGLLYEISQELGEESVQAWVDVLQHLHNGLQDRLRDYVRGDPRSCWPSTGTLLLLSITRHIFSATDFRHVVVTPTMLLLGQSLVNCPVNTISDLENGLFVCVLMTEICTLSAKLAPEVLAFLNEVFGLYLPTRARNAAATRGKTLSTFSSSAFDGLRESVSAYVEARTGSGSHASPFEELKISLCQKSSMEVNPLQAARVLATAYRLVRSIVSLVQSCQVSCVPEILRPISQTLAALRPDCVPILPKEITESHSRTLKMVHTEIQQHISSRVPLQWRKTKRQSIKSFNPRFEERYIPRKGAGTPAHKLEERSLVRKVKREKKAAMRELKRDSEFLEQQRWNEREAKIEAVKKTMRANKSWLQQEQATLNQQVKQGKGLLKGGGSGIKKRARVKR